MKYFPFEKFYLQTKLPDSEVKQRLAKSLVPKKFFRFTFPGSGSDKSYEGRITGNSFEINRVISYRNSFLPVINGTIESGVSGTRIYITMRMHLFVIGFMIIWLGIAFFGGLAITIAEISNGTFIPVMFIPFGMFAFGYLLATSGFKFESRKSKKILQELFEAELVEL